MDIDIAVFYENLVQLAALYVPKLLLAIITLVVGLMTISWLNKRLKAKLARKSGDVSLQDFVATVIAIVLKVALVVVVAGMVGVQTASFVALIGAAGLAVGLAMQGALGNFAGGVMILFYKPFRVGHYIEGAGHSGTVHEIRIFHTVLKTPDNKTIVIPNGELSNESIVNYSQELHRRVDFQFSIGYDDDIATAKTVLRGVADADSRVLQDPEPPFVGVKEHGESAVIMTLRVWTATGNYWPVFWDIMENVKLAFDEHGISIPFPQRDIHVITNGKDGNGAAAGQEQASPGRVLS